jgi:hypothetical protein
MVKISVNYYLAFNAWAFNTLAKLAQAGDIPRAIAFAGSWKHVVDTAFKAFAGIPSSPWGLVAWAIAHPDPFRDTRVEIEKMKQDYKNV